MSKRRLSMANRDWKPDTDITKLDDDALKEWMMSCLINNTTFRKMLRDDPAGLLRCYKLITSDKNYSKEYNELMYYKMLVEHEEDVIMGTDLDIIPLKVDKYGNADIATGHLRLAELRLRNKQWILERRHELWKAKSQQDITSDGKQLGCVIIPKKED